MVRKQIHNKIASSCRFLVHFKRSKDFMSLEFEWKHPEKDNKILQRQPANNR